MIMNCKNHQPNRLILVLFCISALTSTGLNSEPHMLQCPMPTKQHDFLKKGKELPMQPYISGWTYREFCDFAFDRADDYKEFDASKVTRGSTIFVCNIFFKQWFAKVHPFIKEPYILVSANGPCKTPHTFEKYLNDPKIIHWFGIHGSIESHPKFTHIPLGFFNNGIVKHVFDNIFAAKPTKKHLLYVNCTSKTNTERLDALEYFSNQPFAHICDRKPIDEYVLDVAESQFVLSPPGAGPDCYRTWEALAAGSIPIVKPSTIDVLYKDLPVVIVNEWNEITEEFLQAKYREIMANYGNYDFSKLCINYWIDKIYAMKAQALNQ